VLTASEGTGGGAWDQKLDILLWELG